MYRTFSQRTVQRQLTDTKVVVFTVPQIMGNVENNYNSVNNALLETVPRYSFETPTTLRSARLVF
jgi:hypothetical protein